MIFYGESSYEIECLNFCKTVQYHYARAIHQYESLKSQVQCIAVLVILLSDALACKLCLLEYV